MRNVPYGYESIQTGSRNQDLDKLFLKVLKEFGLEETTETADEHREDFTLFEISELILT